MDIRDTVPELEGTLFAPQWGAGLPCLPGTNCRNPQTERVAMTSTACV